MFVDSAALASSTAKNDPRITKVGRWIRRHKIDELPELINVLKGEMSLVGPRPEVPKYTDQYEGEEKIILSVLPGITDYSSIHFIQLGDVLGEGDPDEAFERLVLPTKNKLRVQYVKDRGLWLDLKLIALTLLRIIRANERACPRKPFGV
jgi:lipopolysaccharide/colanic/teichoic acid biosynthesis glycosyltransferase